MKCPACGCSERFISELIDGTEVDINSIGENFLGEVEEVYEDAMCECSVCGYIDYTERFFDGTEKFTH